MVDVDKLISDLTKKFEKELRQSFADFIVEDYKRVLSSLVEEIKVMDKNDNEQESNICNECSKHMCDMCGCEIDSECESESEEGHAVPKVSEIVNVMNMNERAIASKVLTEEQKKNVVKALKGEVEEKVEKVEAKKEEFGNVLGSSRKPIGGRYGRRNFTERLLPPP